MTAAPGTSRVSRTFLVHRHLASREHYDLLLELEDRLACWTLPKPPSPDPKRRRFALRTGDREVGFGRFEGVIPEGEAGAGVVLLWDLGTYEPLPPKGLSEAAWLARGFLRLHFSGEKLRGLWELVRWESGRPGLERWVLLKLRDRHARQTDELEHATYSALTGREAEEIRAAALRPSGAPTNAPETPA